MKNNLPPMVTKCITKTQNIYNKLAAKTPAPVKKVVTTLVKALPKPKLAAKIVGYILVVLSFFQLMLFLGAPMGQAAFGGQYDVLPANLRALCVSTIVVYAITSHVIRSRAGLTKTPSKDSLVVLGTWLAAGIFLFSTFANAISASVYENLIMAPVALVLCVLTFVVAKKSA